MTGFLARRLASLAVTLLLASLVVFGVLEILPGDPALLMLGTEAREDTLAALRAQMGLDRPAPERYLRWVGGLLTGNLGNSLTYGMPVSGLIADRLAVTVPLALMSMALTVLIALPLGMFAASHHRRPGDYGVMAFAQVGISIPNFWFGILLILFFAVRLGWVKSGGFPGWNAGVWPAVQALLLPAVALALTEAAIMARVTRAAVLDALQEDYVRTARAKGVSEAGILLGHVLRNALIPVLTIGGLIFAFLLAGALVIENVFYLPGVGRLVYQAVTQRDLVVVENAVVLLAAMVVVVNFLVDVLYAVVDPRPKART
ncbi:MAG TPA: ABC transporter permease [Azospirillaceae bacterium]|nr:ABC transporter permease [Azospirillaceae bacterium]